MKKSTILIVDDIPKNIQVLANILTEQNYDIEYSTSGKGALDWVNKKNFDLILLDIMMPEMDGYVTCSKLKEMPNAKGIPIIFITAKTEIDSISKAFTAGGVDYITKPFNEVELLARVKTHLELKHNKDQLKQVNNWLEIKVDERTAELKIANTKLLQLDIAKSEFLNIISHEIRTPLNGIVSVLSILNDFQLPPEVKEMLDIMDISANRLEEFSKKALDISLFNTRGKEALNFDRADLKDTIISNVIKSQKDAEKKNISVTQINETNDTLAIIDEAFIYKCFSYIIDNAIKFGNENSQVFIKIANANNNILVSIENEGIPFPENFDITKIQPFNTKIHVDENPALSLFLSRQIVEAHNGQIEIMNTTKGARVNVILPIIESDININ
jgi:two-component system sensor histidine kinase/response regulator